MDYSPPDKKELRNSLERRFFYKNNKWSDGWGCTFYENIIHFIRGPSGLYILDEHPLDIQRTNFINQIKVYFPEKFNSGYELKVFCNCFFTNEEFDKLIDVMYQLFKDGVAQFTSWSRICTHSHV